MGPTFKTLSAGFELISLRHTKNYKLRSAVGVWSGDPRPKHLTPGHSKAPLERGGPWPPTGRRWLFVVAKTASLVGLGCPLPSNSVLLLLGRRDYREQRDDVSCDPR